MKPLDLKSRYVFIQIFGTGINVFIDIFSNGPLGCVSVCADIWSEGEEQQYGGDVYICVQCAGWQCSRNCRFDCW